MAESSKHRERMQKQGYTEQSNRPGYYTKVNHQGFGSAKDAEAHYDTQKSSGGDLIDNAIADWSGQGGGGK